MTEDWKLEPPEWTAAMGEEAEEFAKAVVSSMRDEPAPHAGPETIALIQSLLTDIVEDIEIDEMDEETVCRLTLNITRAGQVLHCVAQIAVGVILGAEKVGISIGDSLDPSFDGLEELLGNDDPE
jgi:hypothetical protein